MTSWRALLFALCLSGCADACEVQGRLRDVRPLADMTSPGAEFQDEDRDGVADAEDNCPLVPNATQEDTDRDQIGDACDSCLWISNHPQQDSDADGVGDRCDPDTLDEPTCFGDCAGARGEVCSGRDEDLDGEVDEGCPVGRACPRQACVRAFDCCVGQSCAEGVCVNGM